jgi:hypothetical protein
MSIQSNYLHNMVGTVIELHCPYKSVVAFQYKGKQERALLKADKVIVDGQNVPMVCLLSGSFCKLTHIVETYINFLSSWQIIFHSS